MSSLLSRLVRRARWGGLIAISGAIGYAAFLGGTAREEATPNRPNPPPEENSLTSTLADAKELTTIVAHPNSLPPIQASGDWDPQPQWRLDMTGSLADQPHHQEHPSLIRTPIPTAFPLPPRDKLEPPTLGDAMVRHTVGRPASEAAPPATASRAASSPFAAKPMFPSPAGSPPGWPGPAVNQPVADPFSSPSATGLAQRQPSAWPDQSFERTLPAEVKPLPTAELSTPHLLTGSVSQAPEPPKSGPPSWISPAPSAAPVPSLTSPVPSSPPAPVPSSPGGRFIRQPVGR